MLTINTECSVPNAQIMIPVKIITNSSLPTKKLLNCSKIESCHMQAMIKVFSVHNCFPFPPHLTLKIKPCFCFFFSRMTAKLEHYLSNLALHVFVYMYK